MHCFCLLSYCSYPFCSNSQPLFFRSFWEFSVGGEISLILSGFESSFLRQKCFRCSYKFPFHGSTPSPPRYFLAPSLFLFIRLLPKCIRRSHSLWREELSELSSMLLSRALSSSWEAVYWSCHPPVPELCSLIIKRRHSYFEMRLIQTPAQVSWGHWRGLHTESYL